MVRSCMVTLLIGVAHAVGGFDRAAAFYCGAIMRLAGGGVNRLARRFGVVVPRLPADGLGEGAFVPAGRKIAVPPQAVDVGQPATRAEPRRRTIVVASNRRARHCRPPCPRQSIMICPRCRAGNPARLTELVPHHDKADNRPVADAQ